MKRSCFYNMAPDRCDSAATYLHDLGWDGPAACSVDCDFEERVRHITSLDPADPAVAENAASWIDAVFDIEVEPARVAVDNSITCPVMNVDLVVPCDFGGCAYHIGYDRTLNCLLHYLRGKHRALRIGEVALLLGKTQQEVRAIYEGAIQKLRHTSITSAQAEGDVPGPRFEFLETSRLCCVCESLVTERDDAIYSKIGERHIVYCDQDCYEHKPPGVIELEDRFGVEAAEIMTWAVGRFKTINSIQEALQLPKDLLVRLCEKIPSLQGRFLPRRRKLAARRTWHSPKWVDEMLSSTTPVLRALSRRTGSDRTFRRAASNLSRRVDRIVTIKNPRS